MKLPFLVSFLLFFLSIFAVTTPCHKHERRALLTFKSHLVDPSNRLSSWKGLNCCNWEGIRCSGSLHVAVVNLRNPNPESFIVNMNGKLISSSNSPSSTNGIISHSLFTLTHMIYLDLSFNNFMFSTIPPAFSNLTSLTYLNLSNAMFNGSITTQFANLSSLTHLDVSCSYAVTDYSSLSYNLSSSLTIHAGSRYSYISGGNLFSPNLDWLQGMHSLRQLVISGVDLSGASESIQWARPLSQLSNLTFLRMSNCRIIGRVPIDHLLNLTRLHLLQMDFNFLAFGIPKRLANLTSLSVLNLRNSNLQGPVPHLTQLNALYVSNNSDLTIDLDKFFEVPWPKLETVDISSTQVTGLIPSSLGNITSLVYFSAYNCHIEGSIPSNIGNLSSLGVLMLDMNNIHGQLPLSLYSLKSLRLLSFTQNYLEGSIPSSICSLTSLQYLLLGINSLTGDLPDCISQLPNLSYLNLGLNKMNGTVLLSSFSKMSPDQISLGFSGLTLKIDQNPFPPSFQPLVLDLIMSKIDGTVPYFISGLTKLEHLTLAYNNLSGAIPSWVFNLPSLGYLDLSFNNLEGVLPPAIQLRSYFGPTTLNLASNHLHGPIPLQLQNIESIDLSRNNFTGYIPAEIDLGGTLYFSLSSNQLSSQIPLDFCHKTTALKLLDLSNNTLSGKIPSSFGNCTFLIFLDLGSNNLSGNFPNELGEARSLSYLDLSNNLFGGSFPTFVQKLQNLMVLKMGYNRFKGNIPQFIGNLKNLHILVLESNSFNGSIPTEINKLEKLQYIGFANNKLSGPIPNKLDGLEMLKKRPKDGNILGYVVSTMYAGVELDMESKGSLHQLEVVRTYHSGIDLSGNTLTGNIPSEIRLLQALYMLNLSHNALSGKIPRGIGNMTGLESLDLSFNNLSGEIPASLNLLDSLSTLNFSHNNLSGKIPPGTRFDTWYGDGSAYIIGNELLCNVPGGISCNAIDDSNPKTQETVDAENANEKLIFYGIMSLGYGVGIWGFFMSLYAMNKEWRKKYWGAIDKIASKIIQGLKR